MPWLDPKLSGDRAGQVIAFLEYLPVTKGILAGKSMTLLPDQREFVREIYSAPPRAKRKIKLAIKSEPKGNGKTGLTAGLALCHLLGPEAEERGEVYSAAIDRPQAAILFAEMEAIIERRPAFRSRVRIVRHIKKIEVLSGAGEGSIYEALSSDARRAHGLAPSLWIYDELAQAKTRELLDNLMQGMSKRAEALGVVISTQAPDDEHPLSQLIDDAISEADNPERTTYLQLHAAPADADPFDPEVWKACNPAFGIFLDAADFAAAADRAKRRTLFLPAFRNLRLNQRIDAAEEERLVTASDWKRGAVPIDLAELEGRACFGGLDLSVKHDLTALVLAFPGEDGSFDIVPFFWTPEGQLKNRHGPEGERFRTWIDAGLIEVIPGDVIRYSQVAVKLAELAERFQIVSIAYDKYHFEYLKVELDEIGADDLPFEPFGQGHSRAMAPAIQFFIECAMDGRLRHGGHAVLTASVVNAVVIPDRAGNPMIDKPASNRRGPVRVDGAQALVMALGTAQRLKGSYGYVESGVMAI